MLGIDRVVVLFSFYRSTSLRFENHKFVVIYIDLFNVIVFILATDHVITVLCQDDQKLWMAKSFPVPIIPIESSPILL